MTAEHPPSSGAAPTPSCGESLVSLLEERGVEVVFGIPGVHTLEIYRGLAGSPIRHVSPRHEQGAAFMADGYSRVSGKPGVCILITGPGVTNAATAVASAYHDSKGILVISSATATGDAVRGHGPLHDLPDQQALMATITAFSETVESAEALPGALDRAFDVLNGPRPRPVHIGIPIDVLSQPAAVPAVAAAPGAGPGSGARPGAREPKAADGATVMAAVELLSKAENPFILLGGGALHAGEEAVRIAACVGAPVVTTTNGKGAIPESSPLALGVTTSIEPVYSALVGADVVLAAGTEFSEVDYYFAPSLPSFQGSLIRVDIDLGQFQKRPKASLELAGDSARTLGLIAEELGRLGTDRSARARATADGLRGRLRWWPGASDYFPVLDAIAAGLGDDAIIASDSTQLAYVANSYLRVERPYSYLCPAGFGTLGPALPMAIGAKLAEPARPVACLVGDGGFLFTIEELATAAELGLAIPIVMWQNHGYGEIRDSMRAVGVPLLGTDASAHDYLQIAEGFGCAAARAGSVGEVREEIRGAFGRDRPTLVEVPASLIGGS